MKNMGRRTHLLFGIIFATFYLSNGCQIDGVTNWLIPVSESIVDTFRGTVFSRSTSNIEGINSVNFFEGLNGGPYLDVSFTDSQFNIVTNAAYADYEEKETAQSFSFTIIFRCTGGGTSTLVFLLNVVDTNNNAPQFMPTSNYEFTIAPPIPPGFLVTGCFNDITVRDIDLTTQRIVYEIEENQYFSIEYDASSSTVAKEFKATLKTTSFIRSIPEPITLRITATDVDLTGDPARSTTATVTIIGDSEFEFPEEPVFSQPFYTANYTKDHQLVVHDAIALQQGFDNQVSFSLEGERSSNFGLAANDNQISLSVVTHLPLEDITESQVILVVRANREYTTGDTAPVIVQLPEEASLEFERAHYEGSIVNNALQLSQLTLTQGYDTSSLSVDVISEYSSYFSVNLQGNQITVTMSPLAEDIINNNNFVYLQILATTDRSSASAIITLEIIKDDTVTPVFNQPIFTGTYDSATGLSIEQIIIVQGYDETVSVNLDGEHASYFQLAQTGSAITLTSSVIPPELFSEQRILLSVRATKPRTVGANAAVIITLPEEVSVKFERAHYEGSIVNNALKLSQLTLSQGYDTSSLSIDVISEHSSYFSVNLQGNQITVTMSPLAEDIINNNNFVYLQIVATTDRSSASAIITLEIIKDDNVTPVFNQPIFTGTYDSATGLSIEQITIVQGYDETVSVNLDGEHASYFQLAQTGSAITLTSSDIPPELFSEQRIVLSVRATKPRTVGANAAVIITLPEARELHFEAQTYKGSVRDNVLILETITLSVRHEENVNFVLTGDLANYFEITLVEHQVSIQLTRELPDDYITANNNIILTLTASGLNAIPNSAMILLEIIKDDLTTPIFNQNLYYGTYSGTSDIEIENINLVQGYDATVTFRIEGEHAHYFTITNTGNSVILSLQSAIPEEVIFNEKVLSFIIRAEKDLTVGANAAIFIRFPLELTEYTVMRFGQTNYIGSIEDDTLSLQNIVLDTGFTTDTEFLLSGDLISYFSISGISNTVSVTLENPLPDVIVQNNSFIVLEIEARRERAISTFASIIIDIITKDIIPPVFSKAYYSGVYTEEMGLQFLDEISLASGYDETVTFTLDGESAVLFNLVQIENSLTLRADTPIPETILQNNNQFLLSIIATKPNAESGQSAIFIDLPKDVPEQIVLRFEQTSYVGTFHNGELQIPAIRLTEEHSEAILVEMSGDYSSYFTLSIVNNIVNIETTEIPDEVLNENKFIILDFKASYPETVTGFTTLVINILKDTEPQIFTPLFERPYYTGKYSEENGLIFDDTIKLIQGFNESVTFSLSGDDSQWFIIVEQNVENSFTLAVKPDSVPQISDKTHFIFSIVAENPGSLSGHTAVVISITDIALVTSLRFIRDFYTGSIENSDLTLDAIRLEEGYSEYVTHSLLGDYAKYFQITDIGGIFTIQLIEVLPVEVLEANNILVFTLEVQNENTRAHATIVLELITSTDSEATFAFEENYYVGSYSETSGFIFNEQIRLQDESNETVQLSLLGGYNELFEIVYMENYMSIMLTSPFPTNLFDIYHQLILTIEARSSGRIATATIVLSLINDIPQTTILGFERINYVGYIQNDTASLQQIILANGYTENVVFTLHGEMADYFKISNVGPNIAIDLQTVIPEQSIPENGFTLLDVIATAPSATTAYTTIVFEFIRENVPAAVELVFDEPFYTGTYSEQNGLTFANPVSLASGFDASVSFKLDGEYSQWFGLVQLGNSVSLTIVSSIPVAVLANNQHLTFVIVAERAGSVSASATIVISLQDEFTENNVLGFDRVTYVGSIDNNTANIQTITLSEGYTQDVTFSIHGEMASYFTISSVGPEVTIALQTPIPEESIPENGFIWLDIRASAPPAMTAFATIVFGFVRENVPAAVELVFDEPFYTGTYSEQDGLTFANPVSLASGFDASVSFKLDGEYSQWFGLVQLGNSVSLTIVSSIPVAVLANNQHLTFVIVAERAGSVSASATIVISLQDEFTENNVLGFDRVTYVGSIDNNTANIQTITLSEGYTQDVTFSIHGEMASYFTISSVGPEVTIALQTPIPEESIPENGFIWLDIRASAPPAMTAFATIVFGFVRENVPAAVELVFDEPFYTGTYSEQDGLTFANPVSLASGFDASVSFKLDGEYSQWFGLVQLGNSVSLTIVSSIPVAVLANNQHLTFVIVAERAGSVSASATIVISLQDEFTENNVLGFDRVTYVGSIDNNTANIQTITLSEGYTQDVTFSIHGEMASYFTISSVGPEVTIALQTPIPEESIPENGFIWLDIRASAPPAMTAFATIVFGFVRENVPAAVELVFDEPFYTGTYSEQDGLTFANPVSLASGFDASVSFKLDGEYSQWFGLVQLGNSVSLTIVSSIPVAVLANNQHLTFVIVAERAGSVSASATIVISLQDEFTENNVLGFDRVTYVGSIDNNTANIQTITLSEGYTQDVTFSIHGEMASYFTISSVGPEGTIALQTPIPEESIPENGFIWLDIRASAPPAMTAFATIVFGFVRENVPAAVELVFDEPFYTGTYSEQDGLTFANPVSLASGFDASVSFKLDGEYSQWFGLVQLGNSVSLTIVSSIPVAVLANNQHLTFVIVAERAGSVSASATIVISLQDEFTENNVLGFDRVTYVGSIDNNTANIQTITLSEGYTQDVTFSIHGEMASYFTISSVGPEVTIALQTPIPEESIPENGFIWLDIRASAPPAMTAFATIVFGFVRENVPAAVELVFDEPFYTGTYSEQDGLTFANPVSLASGFDASVLFKLDGEYSQWFGLVQLGNSVSLTIVSSIPVAVLANNQHLTFVIVAERAGSVSASATIVISLQDEFTENNVLGFDRVTYVGSIDNKTANIQTITLSEGYTQDVTFSIHGEMASYFTISSVGPEVTIALQTPIPEESIPENGFIWLDIRASAPPAVTAFATIVFGFVRENVPAAVELVFDEPFYTGTYSEQDGLTFANPVSLASGFDASVSFKLDGEYSQWFGLVQLGNSVSLTIVSSIPVAVLANNQHLTFVIVAERAGSVSASATIVISLQDEFTENNVLGFDRVTYVGSIDNNTANIQTITLSEGYTQDVTFSIHGEMASYFTISSVGPEVTIALQTPIPEESIPENGFIWLDIRASAPPAMTAFATIVFGFVRENVPAAVELVFDEPFYTGTYSEQDGLTFANSVSLASGFDASVSFKLDGEYSQWFGLVQLGNSVSLTIVSSIPVAVLANNQHLTFVIVAERAGSVSASATIVISLQDEFTENNVLGFDRVTYVGSIDNNTANIQTITLSEGYTQDVTFSIHGEMASYFTISSVGPEVTIALQTPIPEESIPENGFIWLDIRASAPPAVTAFATIVFGFVRENVPAAVELVFDEPFYTGTYSEQDGLTFANPVSLASGFDASVSFKLDGEYSQWFGLVQLGNSVSLTIVSSIPVAVLANNQHLTFVIVAERAGSVSASATIVISLQDEFTENNVLGFDRVTYVGSIDNNTANIQTITLSEGYTQDVTFSIHGEMASYFTISSVGPEVTIALQTPIPEESIPENGFIWLDIRASAPPAMTAFATIVFGFVRENVPAAVELVFDEPFYTGTYSEQHGLTFANPVSLASGFEENVVFMLDGELSRCFVIMVNGNSITLAVSSPIPDDVLMNHSYLIFSIIAQIPGSSTAKATIVISLDDDIQNAVSFGKVLYTGLLQLGVVQHESITLSGFTGTSVQLLGEYASAFEAVVSNGVVTVQRSGAVTLPSTVTQVVLELHADTASAVLLLNVIESENPVLPSVSFSSPSYVLQVGDDQTGIIGRVEATADNMELLKYSLVLDNDHLQSRISINNEGEIHLSAPAASGAYTLQVVATTIITQVSGSATVYLSIETVSTGEENNTTIPPLIILNRDEEETHDNLVVLDGIQFEGCRYTLINRWPADQTWLYVDDIGLHTRAIDREHESIAFMALSQVQVELILHCDSDPPTRTKRSTDDLAASKMETALGPYDYGTKNWIITDTIPYNSRRSFVNLIVNDINDNAPIFIGKENEPIVVGYPVPELEDTVLPRSLAELKATDADIGENAAILYWSSEAELAVAPLTGFVHVRDGARLEHDSRLTVNATDLNGEGHTGSIDLQIKLLDVNNIIVVTIRDAFLNDEKTILENLSTAVGYEVKVLSSAVISGDIEDGNTRRKRETTDLAGASLQLYVYGLIEREPVAIQRLITDINNNAVATIHIASALSLEDHLEGQKICVIGGHDIGLLVSTIVLSILLFILIVLVVLWFSRKWIWRQNYQEFTDENSLASRRESLPEPTKLESSTKPRLNIEELKRSERRLQEMLDAPVRDVVIEPTIAKIDAPVESKVDMTSIDSRTPIVIQSIDKLKDGVDDSSSDDEFGEKQRAKRKSVVTFNENVEKIIHVDDPEDVSPESDYEVYKL